MLYFTVNKIVFGRTHIDCHDGWMDGWTDGRTDEYLAFPIDFARADDIITNLAIKGETA